MSKPITPQKAVLNFHQELLSNHSDPQVYDKSQYVPYILKNYKEAIPEIIKFLNPTMLKQVENLHKTHIKVAIQTRWIMLLVAIANSRELDPHKIFGTDLPGCVKWFTDKKDYLLN